MPPPQPRRSRANLRPPSRSASAVDRLLKNQNPLENRNNLRPSSPHLVVGKRPGTAPQFCGLKFMNTKAILFRSPMLGSGIRGFDGEALGGRRLARTPPSASRPGWRLRQSHHRLQKRSRCSLQPGMTPVPITFLDRKGVVIQALPAAN